MEPPLAPGSSDLSGGRQQLDEIVPDRAALAARTGWAPEVIATLDSYRGSSLVYSFPTEDEAAAALAPLEVIARHTPGYALGERCPTLLLAAR